MTSPEVEYLRERSISTDIDRPQGDGFPAAVIWIHLTRHGFDHLFPIFVGSKRHQLSWNQMMRRSVEYLDDRSRTESPCIPIFYYPHDAFELDVNPQFSGCRIDPGTANVIESDTVDDALRFARELATDLESPDGLALDIEDADDDLIELFADVSLPGHNVHSRIPVFRGEVSESRINDRYGYVKFPIAVLCDDSSLDREKTFPKRIEGSIIPIDRPDRI